ncbi:winged helix-turn-helix transcriptional regulator [Vagococcus sp. JNUCC 83]
MSYYGYVIKTSELSQFLLELEQLLGLSCEDIFVENSLPNTKRSTELKRLLSIMTTEDCLVIPNLSKIYLDKFFNEKIIKTILSKEIKVRVLQEKKHVYLVYKDNTIYLNSNKILEKLQHRKTVGRPKVNQNKIDKLIEYRENRHLTYREISDITGLSLGTVYKYTKKKHE